MEPKTGKKIVSKGRYVKAQFKKMWLYYDALAALIVLPYLAYSPLSRLRLSPFWFMVLMAGLTVLSVMNFMRIAKSSFQEARSIDPGVPLTRANVADLPAPDSLVRASEQPLKAQQAVLLRAAAEGVGTPSEQLVRASVGVE